MFLEPTILERAARISSKEIDEAIYNFLEKQGYTDIRNMSDKDISKLQREWETEGIKLRCDNFIKSIDLISAKQGYFPLQYVTIISFDKINNPRTRRQIYDENNLKEKGYML